MMFQIVFSDAWWIGTKEENPEEAKLDFPKELLEVAFSLIISILRFLNLFYVHFCSIEC